MTGLSDLGTATRGVWTRERALAVMTRGHVQAHLRQGVWQQAWPGVYADGGCELDAEQRAFAAVLASGGASQPVPLTDPAGAGGPHRPRAIACGRTAARVHGFPLVDDDDPATGAEEGLLDHVAVRFHGAPLSCQQSDLRVRMLTRHEPRWGPGDIVRLESGLYVSSPLRTLIDCANLLCPAALVCALDDALHRGVVTQEDLLVAVVERAWCAGAVALRSATGLADGRAESPAETLARLLLLPSVPGLVPQHRLLDGRGRILARFDLGDEHLRLAVEVDGRRGHAGARMAAKDQQRDRTSGTLGWRTERCTWWELRRRTDDLVRRVVTAAGDQARRRRPSS